MFFTRQRKVFFVIGGVQKSGTTALDAYLREHPDICMASVKEPHFFDDDEHFGSGRPDYGLYHENFHPDHSKQILGDATPVYSYWKQAPSRIHAYNPAMKWILVLRNPIERAFSHWNMEYQLGKELHPFSQAIRLERAMKQHHADDFQFRIFSYIDRGFYARQLKHLWKLFPREQTLVLRQEDLLNNPTRCVNHTLRFLGLTEINDIAHREVFSTAHCAEMSESDRKQLTETFRPDIEELEQLLNWDCRAWLGDAGPPQT